MEQMYRQSNTSVSLLNYHFVFCPRYRRKVLVGEVEKRLQVLLTEACGQIKCDIIALEIMPDHVHLFVNALPKLSPSDLMAKLKGYTSRKLRQEFPQLRHLSSLWTRSFFVASAGNVSSEIIQCYILNQKKRG